MIFESYSGITEEVLSMRDMRNDIVRTEKLKKYYRLGENTVKALDGVDFSVKERGCCFIFHSPRTWWHRYTLCKTLFLRLSLFLYCTLQRFSSSFALFLCKKRLFSPVSSPQILALFRYFSPLFLPLFPLWL